MHTFKFTWCHVMDTSSFGTEQCFPLPAPVGCFQLHPWTDVHVAHRATRRIKKQISADFFQKLIACSRVLGHDSRASRILGLVDPFIAHRFAFAKLKLETCNLKLITSQSSQVNLVLHHIHHIIKYPIFQKNKITFFEWSPLPLWNRVWCPRREAQVGFGSMQTFESLKVLERKNNIEAAHHQQCQCSIHCALGPLDLHTASTEFYF